MFSETLTDFINADTPGYFLATVGGVPVGGLFDNAYFDPLGIAGSTPAILCASADVSNAAQGTAVVVDGVNYTVGNIQPDGTGMTRLMLQEA